jgi:hypothetical protein
MTGVAKKTVMRFLVEIGEVCEAYQDRVLRNLSCRRVQLDELWGFNYCKQKNVTPEIAEKVPGAGDVWLWVAIDAETKLVPCWRLGDRNGRIAFEFVRDLASRLRNRIQLTSDGHRVYLDAVENAFGSEVDYSMLVKLYGADREESETRYSPAECIGCRAIPIIGRPDPRHISTSYVERQNWERAYRNAAIHAALEWLLAQDSESRGGDCPKLFRLQLHKDSQDIARQSGNGC